MLLTREAYGQWLRTSPTRKLVLYATPGGIIGAERAAWMADNFPNTDIQ